MADEGFFSRWSRRKHEGGGDALPTPRPPAAAVPEAPVAAPEVVVPAAPEAPAPAAPAPPPPTLQDVEALTPEADFTRFVKADVDPGVQRAALKKLFADPQFNVMDGLDVYIDDYHTPDPLPESILRQMVQSRLLGLFDAPPQTPPDDAEPAAAPALALPTETAPDEDPDLRLQPHDAAGRAEPEPGAGSHPGCEP